MSPSGYRRAYSQHFHVSHWVPRLQMHVTVCTNLRSDNTRLRHSHLLALSVVEGLFIIPLCRWMPTWYSQKRTPNVANDLRIRDRGLYNAAFLRYAVYQSRMCDRRMCMLVWRGPKQNQRNLNTIMNSPGHILNHHQQLQKFFHSIPPPQNTSGFFQ